MYKFISWAVAVALCTLCASAGSAASVAELKAEIEGVWALEEWHSDGKILRPPQIEGRLVLANGAAIAMLMNYAQETNQTSIAEFGVYVLDDTSFSYRYDIASGFKQGPSGITTSRKPGFEGMRRFVASFEGKALHLSSDQQEFVFTSGAMTYSDNGKLLRVWRRIKGD
jgi:hypothetical protein